MNRTASRGLAVRVAIASSRSFGHAEPAARYSAAAVLDDGQRSKTSRPARSGKAAVPLPTECCIKPNRYRRAEHYLVGPARMTDPVSGKPFEAWGRGPRRSR